MSFERAKTFDDLLAANGRFLCGDLRTTPYCCGLSNETGQLLSSLVRLHDPSHRVFTTESQPGLHEARWVEPWLNATTGITGGSAFVETQQRVSGGQAAEMCTHQARSLQVLPCRTGVLCGACPHAAFPDRHARAQQAALPASPLQAYVVAIVEAARLPTLLARLRRHALSLCYFVDVPGQPEVYTTWGIPKDEVWTSTHGTPRLSLTRTRSAPTKAGLPAAPWKLFTNAVLTPGLADTEVGLLAGGSPALVPALERCAVVGVMAKRFGQPAEDEPCLLDLLLLAAAAGVKAGGDLAEADGVGQLIEEEVVE